MHWKVYALFGAQAVFQRVMCWEISLHENFCPGPAQGAGDRASSLLYMSGAPGDHRWCTAIRGSKPAFTLATRDVVGDAVEISLYSDAGCNKPFAANITFDGCIAGPREHGIRSVRVLPAEATND